MIVDSDVTYCSLDPIIHGDGATGCRHGHGLNKFNGSRINFILGTISRRQFTMLFHCMVCDGFLHPLPVAVEVGERVCCEYLRVLRNCMYIKLTDLHVLSEEEKNATLKSSKEKKTIVTTSN